MHHVEFVGIGFDQLSKMVLYYHVTQYRNYPTLKQIFYPRSFHGRHFRSLLYPAHHTKPNIESKNIFRKSCRTSVHL